MLSSLTIENFRGFGSTYTLPELTRINLLVGKNNCGKTSVLEAIQLWAARTDHHALFGMLYRRGEFLTDAPCIQDSLPVEITHLFHGHMLSVDQTSFRICGIDDKQPETVTAELRSSPDDRLQLFELDEANGQGGAELIADPKALHNAELVLQWSRGENPKSTLRMSIVGRGQLQGRAMGGGWLGDRNQRPVVVLSPETAKEDWPLQAFAQVQLTPEEDEVIKAVQQVDPHIERIAVSPVDVGERSGGVRYRFVVKRNGLDRPVPMGVLGDGVWHTFLLALALVRAKGGLLLIDDIDTGLHYSTMADLWRFVSELAAPDKLNVQVFATTHSRDCYESLAEVVRDEVVDGESVSIHRIEAGLDAPVSFHGVDVRYVAEHELEVR